MLTFDDVEWNRMTYGMPAEWCPMFPNLFYGWWWDLGLTIEITDQ